jgi:hypothetical protein
MTSPMTSLERRRGLSPSDCPARNGRFFFLYSSDVVTTGEGEALMLA